MLHNQGDKYENFANSIEIIRKELGDYSQLVPILVSLKHPGISERHW